MKRADAARTGLRTANSVSGLLLISALLVAGCAPEEEPIPWAEAQDVIEIAPAAVADRPNLILIMADDLGYGTWRGGRRG